MTETQDSWRDQYPVRRFGLVAVFATLFVIAGTAAVTSVDRIDFQSNSDFFGNEAFVISYLSDFSTDKIDVVLGQSDLSDAADGEVSQDLSIFVESQNTYAEYSIADSVEQDLVNLEPIKSDPLSSSDTADDWAVQHCYDIGQNGNIQYVVQSTLTFTGTKYEVYCARYNGEWGPIGNIQTPRELFETTWQVEADDEPAQTPTLSNNDIGEGRTTRIGDHVVVQWDGNVDLGRDPPNPGDEGAAALYVRTANDWRVISASRYDDWDTYVRDTLVTRYDDWAEGSISQDELRREIQSRAESAASVYSSSDLATASTSGDASSGHLRLNMDGELAWPQFTVYVDGAEYVRVEKPVGTPEIVSTDGDRFGELESGTVSMTVENVGDGDGSFSARIQSCSSGFGFDDVQQTEDVAESSTVTYEFDVSLLTDADDEVSGQCTVEVANQEGFAVTDDVEVTGIPEQTCTPGERFDQVDANGVYTIYECTEDGSDYFVDEECGHGEETDIVDDELQCVEEEVPPDDDGLLERVTNGVGNVVEDVTAAITNPFNNMLRLVGLVAAVVVFVLMFNVATHPWLESFAALTASVLPLSEDQTQYLVGIVLGLIGAWLAYDVFTSWAFYVGLAVVTVVYLYIRGPLQALDMLR
ncbi:hypothetical protein HT576_08760 [Haloterrigena sp. SYSU A121-1]|uniref:Fusexin 1 n=1 Tax=Haloterrigena gelatinilytica TaxID=2741724 RepID=A0A8J8GKY0_9EURY|nr:hypothetical protein [Haloterrigena gelatinilytica]NUB91110.1 hypothetical protein [Haloterrigena gelatinilytica]